MLARDWLILSTKEKPRILIGAWGGTNMILIGAWHKPTNKHIYIPTPEVYIYRLRQKNTLFSIINQSQIVAHVFSIKFGPCFTEEFAISTILCLF